MPPRHPAAALPPPEAFRPTTEHPVRVRARHLQADMHVTPHRHDWGQLTYSPQGVLRVETEGVLYTAPPSRAVWVPPSALHAVTVLEEAELRTLYIHARAVPRPFRASRVIAVSALLRELIAALDCAQPPAGADDLPHPTARQRALARLILDELLRSPSLSLGTRLPQDKRLRMLCESVLRRPRVDLPLAELARRAGLSERTAARLFHAEVGMSFTQWRQQVLLSAAVVMAGRGLPIGLLAGELGYASASAFSAMVRQAVGQPPRQFFGQLERLQ